MRTKVAATVLAAFASTLVLAGSAAAKPSGGGHSGGHGGGSHGGGGSHAVPRSGNGGGHGSYGGGHGSYRGGGGYYRGGGQGYYRGGGHGYYRGGGHGYYRGGGHGYYYGHGRYYYPYYGYGYYPYWGSYPWWGFGLGLSFYYDNSRYDAPYAYAPYAYPSDPSYGVSAPSGDDQADDAYAYRDDRAGAPGDVARPAGELRLTVRPSDASVYVDGEFRGTAARLETLWLAPGRHRLEVVRPGYRTDDRYVDVSRDAPTTVDVDLDR